jgi:erythronate-4-phosphate dehydrogenase
MAKIVIDDKIPFIKGVFEKYAQVSYLPGGKITPQDVKDADALIVRTRTKCNKALLENSNVKHISTATIGYDHINVKEVEDLGITWNNAPGCNSSSVQQYIAAILATFEKDPKDLTLGVVGVGYVGKKVVSLAQTMGLKVLQNDPPRADKEGQENFVSLEEICQKSDIVTIHVPLEYDGPYPTFHLFDNKVISSMKKNAMLINASRGEACDTAALIDALKNKHLSKAFFDVWENEPEISQELVNLSAIATMHIAGYSADGKANGTSASVQAVAKKLNIPELTNFVAQDIPLPPQGTEIILNEKDDTFTQVKNAILFTYNILEDDKNLRNNLSCFEELRGKYPIRREFPAFNVYNATDKAKEILQKLKFNVK